MLGWGEYKDVDGWRVRVRVGKENTKRGEREKGTRNKGTIKETFLPTKTKANIFVGAASQWVHTHSVRNFRSQQGRVTAKQRVRCDWPTSQDLIKENRVEI